VKSPYYARGIKVSCYFNGSYNQKQIDDWQSSCVGTFLESIDDLTESTADAKVALNYTPSIWRHSDRSHESVELRRYGLQR